MATQPLVLHAHATGPNPIKIAIALEALKLPYRVQQWEFGDNPERGVKGAAFLKINENGRVPALEDPNTGVVSWESGACMNYLRRVYDKQQSLGPLSQKEQDVVDFEKWEYFLLTTLGPMTGQTNWFRHYHSTKNDDALARYEAQTYRCFDVLEGQLKKSGGASILPGKVTAVDYHFEPWVRQYSFAGISLDKYPGIAKWLNEMKAREEVKQAYVKVKGAAP
ncbi:Glutathione S-transferase protein-domain protein [Aspergillus sclerotialis]|uniref:Glutathione S-transferase protein-domain protein n=1 Tax=Aspergillus sclerotialis TaxID=2070753 RepID=A0A3A2ZAX4_9EURO|nr:Glutathione S-transferase protein-domain protein [Aspergillus sclerotialis]